MSSGSAPICQEPDLLQDMALADIPLVSTLEPADQFRLPRGGHLPVAGECRQDVLMPEVLTPSLELLGRPADALTQLRQRLSKAVGVEVWQPRCRESVPENGPDR